MTAVESPGGIRATGIGGTAVLWSDPSVFFSFSEAGGNGIMALLAERAAQLSLGKGFLTPQTLSNPYSRNSMNTGKTHGDYRSYQDLYP